MQLSQFGHKFTSKTGILQLMDDLGKALSINKNMLMLGGGNPSHIQELDKLFQRKLQQIAKNAEKTAKMIGNYDSPQGNSAFIKALANLFQTKYGWDITEENIALTTGSQQAFFYLFNLFAGKRGKTQKKILLPITPEYIGYADVGLSKGLFKSYKPKIQELENSLFKYRVDFSKVRVGRNIGAICVSRPTNPTANVLSNNEIKQLLKIAKNAHAPLIIDNAYGAPFPQILYTKAKPIWDKNIVYCMSLSKIGLPGTRTGIVIANKDIIKAITSMNAITTLAPNQFGPALVIDLVKSTKIITISKTVIMPFYQKRMEQALVWIRRYLDGVPYRVHKPEGSLFLWLWFDALPITSGKLYERLKKCNVLVVPGEYFFPGMEHVKWKHKTECIRITYSQDEEIVKKGIQIIGRELKKVYSLQHKM